MKKPQSGCGPRWGLVRTNTARALGRAGGLKAPGIFKLEPVLFRNLYRIAHSEAAVEKWDNSRSALNSVAPAYLGEHESLCAGVIHKRCGH